MLNIALYQPDIPQNTAAIIRTCACFNLKLEIIKPTSFILNKKKLGRVYMDYFDACEIIYYESFDDFLEKKDQERVILFTTKTKKTYHTFQFKINDTLLFGNESSGVSEKVHRVIENKLNIPIQESTRSLNLASSVAIASSEALRQMS